MFLITYMRVIELESSQSEIWDYKNAEIYSIVFGYVYFSEVT